MARLADEDRRAPVADRVMEFSVVVERLTGDQAGGGSCAALLSRTPTEEIAVGSGLLCREPLFEGVEDQAEGPKVVRKVRLEQGREQVVFQEGPNETRLTREPFGFLHQATADLFEEGRKHPPLEASRSWPRDSPSRAQNSGLGNREAAAGEYSSRAFRSGSASRTWACGFWLDSAMTLLKCELKATPDKPSAHFGNETGGGADSRRCSGRWRSCEARARPRVPLPRSSQGEPVTLAIQSLHCIHASPPCFRTSGIPALVREGCERCARPLEDLREIFQALEPRRAKARRDHLVALVVRDAGDNERNASPEVALRERLLPEQLVARNRCGAAMQF